MKSYVIYHEDDGIYLGNCMGFGFWTKLDPVGQDAAPIFPTEEEALQHIKAISETTPHLSDCRTVPVETESEDHYADIQACTKAGLPSWNPNRAQSCGSIVYEGLKE